MAVSIRKINKVEKLAAVLRKNMQNGRLPHDTRLLSSRELGRKFAVAPLTADRAVRRLVDEGLLRRVRGQGTFVVPRRRVLLIVANPGNIATMDSMLIKESNRTLLEELALLDVQAGVVDYQELRRRHFSPRVFDRCDGVLFHSSFNDLDSLETVRQCRLPVVEFAQSEPADEPFHQVILDYNPGFAEIFRRVGDISAKRFLIFEPVHPERHHALLLKSQIRIRIFRTMAQLRGVAPERIEVRPLAVERKRNIQQLAYEAAMPLEELKDTVIFTPSDMVAFGIYQAFAARGIASGGYTLIGCDNFEGRGLYPFGRPVLTSVDHPNEEVARQAVRLLLAQIEHPSEYLETRRISCRLVIRDSAFGAAGDRISHESQTMINVTEE